MTSNLERLEDIQNVIRSLLVARNSQDVTVIKLNKMYKDIVDEYIPFKDFYYTSLEKFLRSMPDVLTLKYNQAKQLCAYHIDTEKSKHISSLVAREKPDTNSDKYKSKFKVYHTNPINPYILNEVLQELRNTPTHKKNKNSISKTAVLSAVAKRIGTHSFYTIEDLNSQLHECLHILIHDDDRIYFKDNLANNHSSSQNNEIINTNVKSIEIDNQIIELLDVCSVSNLIKETTKIRLQKLIEKHVEGIWCSELPRIYQQEYGIELEYSDLGFNSIVEFAAALPDILQVVEPLSAKRSMILGAKTSIAFSESKETSNSSLLKKYTIIKDHHTSSTKSLLKVCKALIPDDVMGFNETVDQIRVSSLIMDPINNSLRVIVSEVHNPSFFWVTLCKNEKKITKLMKELEKFYSQDCDNYRIPNILLRPGLHVTCTFEEIWHRGIIRKFKADGSISVHLYDYGTKSTFNPNQLYFLSKKFSGVPAQAIPCSLYNVKPIETNKWSKKINKKFTKEVFPKSFIANIMSIGKENNSMVIELIGTNSDQLVGEMCINQWMVAKKLAEWGESLYKIDNVTFEHHQQCWNQNDKENCVS